MNETQLQEFLKMLRINDVLGEFIRYFNRHYCYAISYEDYLLGLKDPEDAIYAAFDFRETFSGEDFWLSMCGTWKAKLKNLKK